MTTERVIEKLRKLKSHAESAEEIGSTEEAAAFAAAFQRLLTEHKLDMSDIEFEALDEEDPVGRHEIDYEKAEVKLSRSRSLPSERLAGIIARAHYCRIIVHNRSSRISLVGRKSDCEVAEFMFVTLYRAMMRLADKANGQFRWECYKRDGHCMNARGFRTSFIVAFITRLSERYDEERRRRDAEANASSTALVRISKSETAAQDWLDAAVKAKDLVNGRSLRRRYDVNLEGRRRGIAAANSIDLGGKAVKGTTRGQLS